MSSEPRQPPVSGAAASRRLSRAENDASPGNNGSFHLGDTIRSVQRALMTLDAFSTERAAMTKTQLVAHTGLPRSTALRLIHTLIEAGWLFVRADHLITLGPRLIPLSQVIEEQWSISEASRLVLDGIVSKTSETANIYVRDGLSRVCVAQRQSPLMVRYVIPVGVPVPLWLGASGHVLLSAAPPKVQKAAISAGDLDEASQAALEEQLERTLEDGHSVTHGEREAGASSVAVPVTDSRRQVIAALAISGPTSRFQSDRIPELVAIARAAAQQLSQTAGPVLRI